MAAPSTIFLVRQYREATPFHRRQILMGGLGAVAVAAVPLALTFFR